MVLSLYMRVVYVGPDALYDGISKNDIGYVIEEYGDGNYEVEFSNADGTTRAQAAIAGKYLESAEDLTNQM